METLVSTILAAKRKRLFGSRPIFEQYEADSTIDFDALERDHGFSFPGDLRFWLERCGFGDLDQQFSIRADWIEVIDRGQLKGHVKFAQDDLGNFYSFEDGSGHIHFISRSTPEFASVSDSFEQLLEVLVGMDFNIETLVESLSLQPYTWDA